MLHSLSELLTPVQRDGLVAVVLLVLTGALGLAVARLTFSLLTKLAARRNNAVLGAVLRRAEPPSRFIFPLVAVEAALPYGALPEWLNVPAERVAALCITVATAWVVITLVELLADLAKLRYRIDEPDNLRARQGETRLDILSRTVATPAA